MKIHKVRPWRWKDGYRCNPLDASISRYIIGREVGFDELDYNRVRDNRKNCIICYKLIKWKWIDNE